MRRPSASAATPSSHAGSTISVAIMLAANPSASRTPMLAVPTCDENARLPKLATVVSPLASTARIVLVLNSCSASSVRMRCTTWMPLSTPMPTSNGNAMMLA